MTRVLGTVLILSLVGAVSSWLAVNDFVALDDGTTKKFVLAAVLVLTGVAAFAIHKRAGGRAAACVGVGALAAGACSDGGPWRSGYLCCCIRPVTELATRPSYGRAYP